MPTSTHKKIQGSNNFQLLSYTHHKHWAINGETWANLHAYIYMIITKTYCVLVYYVCLLLYYLVVHEGVNSLKQAPFKSYGPFVTARILWQALVYISLLIEWVCTFMCIHLYLKAPYTPITQFSSGLSITFNADLCMRHFTSLMKY